MVTTVFDAVSGKFIPVQIKLRDVNLTNAEFTQTAYAFLSMAQKDSIAPIVAIEVRESKTRGIYIKYLAEKPTKRNVKSFEQVWQEIKNTTFEYSVPHGVAVSENMIE